MEFRGDHLLGFNILICLVLLYLVLTVTSHVYDMSCKRIFVLCIHEIKYIPLSLDCPISPIHCLRVLKHLDCLQANHILCTYFWFRGRILSTLCGMGFCFALSCFVLFYLLLSSCMIENDGLNVDLLFMILHMHSFYISVFYIVFRSSLS